MDEKVYGPCDFCDGTGKVRYASKSEMRRLTIMGAPTPPEKECAVCEGTGRQEYVSEPIHRVRLVFADGKTHDIEMPEHCLQPEIVTGRPDRMENVTMRLIKKDEAGIYHYREPLRAV